MQHTAEIILATCSPLLPHHEAVVRLVGADPIIASLTGCPRWEAGGRHMTRLAVAELANQPDDIRRHVHAMAWTARWESPGVLLMEPFADQVDDIAGVGILNMFGDDHRDDCGGHARVLLHRITYKEQPAHG